MEQLDTKAIMAAIIYASRSNQPGFLPDKHYAHAAKEAKLLWQAVTEGDASE